MIDPIYPKVMVDLSVAPIGGAGTYAAGLLGGLVGGSIPSKSQIVVLLSESFVDANPCAIRALESVGIITDVLRLPRPGTWKARLGRGRSLRRAARRHSVDGSFFPREIGPRIDSPYVVMAGNLYAWQTYSTPTPAAGRLSLFLLRNTARRRAARARAVLAVSRAMLREMPENIVVTDVVHPGCDLPEFERDGVGPTTSTTPVLAMVGNVLVHKGIETVVDAVALLREHGTPCDLLVYGSKQDASYAERVERRAVARLGGRILQGAVAGDALRAAYQQADVLVVGGSFETFCFPLIEGMRSGCAVVAPNSALVNEICGDVAVTYTESDAGSLADAIATALAERFERSRLGVKRSRTFTWERCAERTLLLVRKAFAAD